MATRPLLRSQAEDADATAVLCNGLDEFFVGVARTDFSPELVDAAGISHCLRSETSGMILDNVVEGDDSSRPDQRREVFKVLLNPRITVVAVDKEEIEALPTNYLEHLSSGFACVGVRFDEVEALAALHLGADAAFDALRELHVNPNQC